MIEPTERKPENPPAYPRPTSTDETINPANIDYAQTGMTLRDYFAGQALMGTLANDTTSCTYVDISEGCYEQADAMLKARETTLSERTESQWTDADLAALRKGKIQCGIALLPKDTREKVLNALFATPHDQDFESTFSDERLSRYNPNMENAND